MLLLRRLAGPGPLATPPLPIRPGSACGDGRARPGASICSTARI